MPSPDPQSRQSPFSEGLGFEAAFYNLPDPVLIYDHTDRKIILSNEAAVQKYGFTENEFRQMGPWDIEAPYSEVELAPKIDKLKEQGSVVYHTEHRSKDGHTFPVEMHTIFRELEGRNIFIAICRDLKERLNTEHRIEKAETHYRAIFENTISLICVADLQTGYYLDINPAFEATLGYTKEELLSKPLIEFIHPDDREPTKSLIDALIERNQTNSSFQNRIRHKAGHYVWLDWSSRPLPEKSIVYAVAHDISERKWFEEKLQAQNQRMRLHVEQTPLGVIEWGLDFRITEWNQAATQIFGYTREEAIGKKATFIVPEEAHDKVKFTWDKLVSKTGGKRSINKNVHKDASELICEWHNTPLVDRKGEVVGVASLVLDVTDAEQRKDELKRAKIAAEKANKAKSEFLSMMSHELRTPLNSIVGPCELLKMQIDDETKLPLVDVMLASSSHLLELINSILELSKIESGTLEPEYETIEIEPFLERRLLPLASSARKKGLSYTLENRTPCESVIRTDGQLLLQVLFNIVGNAIKFTDSGSVVVTASADNNSLCITVSDTGPGIPDLCKESLFEPFRQGRESLSKSQQGSGLGLAISKRIVELLNGEIKYKNLDGSGSMFQVNLPGLMKARKGSSPVQQREEAMPEPRQDSARILLVEDEPNNKLVTSAILKHLKYPHDIAESGEEAIELWKTHRYPIVLMDVKLPKIDGVTATRRIKSLAGKLPVWVIAQSAFAMSEQRERFLAQGMDDYISKPISIPALQQALDRANEKTKT
ncbi:PAS domain S-box protein [Pelagicoccus sp. SDUM812002]|uniref:PAS domain S-box protein n=1 Tax=Pelagicoccus sp. SDUM812002 TaxID=3041266 RepID=UPI0028109BDF|nr:PAS domain S-box protein [Pelagicoccus sp. SDUM812002]MDQ8188124.1 PAS domain S-box protein [Pelagicoccus sp. SDUM812002]